MVIDYKVNDTIKELLKVYERIRITTLVQKSGILKSDLIAYLKKLSYTKSISISIDEANDIIEVSQNGLNTEHKIDSLKSNYKSLLDLQKETITLDFDRKLKNSKLNMI